MTRAGGSRTQTVPGGLATWAAFIAQAQRPEGACGGKYTECGRTFRRVIAQLREVYEVEVTGPSTRPDQDTIVRIVGVRPDVRRFVPRGSVDADDV